VLQAGERVITDGKKIARTRCGNQVAAEPGITSPAEPDASVLDMPAIPISPCPICAGGPGGATPGNGFVSLPSGLAGSASSGSGLVSASSGLTGETTPANDFLPPPSGFDGGAIPGNGFVPAPSGLAGGADRLPTPVPEPGSLLLMLIGGGGFAVRCLAGKRRADRSTSRAPLRRRSPTRRIT
jgi:hypothetical protein